MTWTDAEKKELITEISCLGCNAATGFDMEKLTNAVLEVAHQIEIKGTNHLEIEAVAKAVNKLVDISPAEVDMNELTDALYEINKTLGEILKKLPK